MALPIFSAAPVISASNDLNPMVSKTLTSARNPLVQTPQVPLIQPVRVPVSSGLPVNPTPLSNQARTIVSQAISSRNIQSTTAPALVNQGTRNLLTSEYRQTLPSSSAPASPFRAGPPVSSSVPVVLPKTDLFIDPVKRPALSKRLPPARLIPTRQAEDAAMPSGAGEKRVVGHDIAPVRAIRPSPVVASEAAQSATSHGIKPSANVRSTLASKVAQNPFDKSMTQGGPVPPPPWYVDNYMHAYDKLSGMGAVESSSSQNWGWALAAGLAVSAAFFWAKSRVS